MRYSMVSFYCAISMSRYLFSVFAQMFKSCKALKTIHIPLEVEFIHDSAFYKSDLDLSELTATWREKAAELEEKVLERDGRILALEARIAALEGSCEETVRLRVSALFS